MGTLLQCRSNYLHPISTSAVPTIWAKCFALTTQKFNKVADRHSLARQVGTALGHPTANRRLFGPNLSPDQVGTALRWLFWGCLDGSGVADQLVVIRRL